MKEGRGSPWRIRCLRAAACPFCVDFLEIGKAESLDGLERKRGDYVAAQEGKADVIWM